MKTLSAATFKAQCLALMDEVEATRESIVVTKRGRPVAKLVPVETGQDDILGFMTGKGRIIGDIVSPVFDLDEWDFLK